MPAFDWVIRPTDDCDVRLGRNERNAVINEPLFFCPDAASVAADHGLGASTIAKSVSAARVAGAVGRQEVLGRAAIENVLKCRPTTFVRLANTLNVINFILVQERESEPLLKSSSIIAAVFRVADFGEITSSLQISCEEIAHLAGVDAALVNTLKANYRLHLDPTLKIVAALRADQRVIKSRWYDRLGREEFRGSIVVDVAGHRNVQKLSQDDDGTNPVYLLDPENLVPAPLNGHDWSIIKATADD